MRIYRIQRVFYLTMGKVAWGALSRFSTSVSGTALPSGSLF